MATSSITHNFVIKGAAVEAFVKAIEDSEAAKAQLKQRPRAIGVEITDPEEAWRILRKAAARSKAHGKS